MGCKISFKNTRGAINRTIVLLLILIAVMLGIISVPAAKAFRYRSEVIGCEQAMKSAGDGLIIDYLYRFEESNVKDARGTLKEVMPARDNLCPAGGVVYLIKNSLGVYEPVCGLHDKDVAHRTRLNASYGLELLKTARKKILDSGGGEPESVTITLNGKELDCICVTEEEVIHRGTATTNGYKGIVAYYGVSGNFRFSAKTAGKGEGSVRDGDICYFLYADEHYCAIWRSNDGWDGDAYQ